MTDIRTVTVSAKPLREILEALTGPPHRIRELQFTRDVDTLVGKRNPINQLIDEYNGALTADAKGGHL